MDHTLPVGRVATGHLSAGNQSTDAAERATIVEVWKDGASIRANATVLLGVMRLAYSRVQKHFAEARPDKPHSRKDEQDKDLFKSLLTTEPNAVWARAPSSTSALLPCMHKESILWRNWVSP